MVTRHVVVGEIVHNLTACAAVEPALRVSTDSHNGIPNSHYREESDQEEAAQSAIQKLLNVCHERTRTQFGKGRGTALKERVQLYITARV